VSIPKSDNTALMNRFCIHCDILPMALLLSRSLPPNPDDSVLKIEN
jgi:hypothetical protein